MSLRRIATIVSLALVVLLVVLAWEDIRRAWELLGQVHLGILALIIPAQLLSYYASGAVLTSFLKAKGNLRDVGHFETGRFALEFNFVNHILPSGGISGLSYAAWRFKKLGVSPSRTALASVLRAALVFIIFLIFLVISVYALAIGGDANQLLLVMVSSLSTLIVAGTLLVAYLIHSRTRSKAAGRSIARLINLAGRKILRRERIIKQSHVEDFFLEISDDYRELRKSPRQLKKPLAWTFVFLVFEVAMYFIVFAALGNIVSPAALLVAYGVGNALGILIATPGGVGGQEAGMVIVLTTIGIPGGAAIAAVILTRVILVLLTLASGYVFYQMTLSSYGKDESVQPAQQ